MDEYTIHCTEEQTKKAFELGAPIKYKFTLDNRERGKFETPTAEQMIGWLEMQENINYITISKIGDYWYYDIYTTDNAMYTSNLNRRSRKEATLDAIDEALNYLIETKKK